MLSYIYMSILSLLSVVLPSVFVIQRCDVLCLHLQKKDHLLLGPVLGTPGIEVLTGSLSGRKVLRADCFMKSRSSWVGDLPRRSKSISPEAQRQLDTPGGFRKWRYPSWMIYNGKSMKILWKWMIWGYPHFRKPPYWPPLTSMMIHVGSWTWYSSYTSCRTKQLSCLTC